MADVYDDQFTRRIFMHLMVEKNPVTLDIIASRLPETELANHPEKYCTVIKSSEGFSGL